MARKAEKTTKTTKATKTSKPLATSLETSKKATPKTSSFKLKRSYILWALAIIVAIGAIYLMRNFIVAATVNGQPISRLSVVQELERQGGRQALNALITKTLIMQEARKQNVTVSQSDVDSELKRIEDNIKKQGQTLDQALMLQGMTRENLVEQIRLQKMIEKIVGKDVRVTDKEVADYLEANKDALPQTEDTKAQQAQIKEQLKQQKLNEKVNTWIENLRKNAKISSFVSYYP